MKQKMKLWMMAAILICGATMALTSLTFNNQTVNQVIEWRAKLPCFAIILG